MGLAFIGAQLARALQLLLQLLGFAKDQATAEQALQIEQIVANSELELINLTHGLAAAYDQRVDILSRLTILQASVDAIPTGPQLAGSPVTLPSSPPSGYGGGPTSSDIAAIWAYQYPPGSGNIVGDKLVKAGRGIEFLQQDSYYQSAYNKYLGHHFDTSVYIYEPSSFYMPNIDPLTILSTDTSIVNWLNRTTTGFTWSLLNNQVVSYSHTVISDEWWVCTITQLEFEQYKAAAPVAPPLTLPVWPGFDLVTMSDPVTMHASGTLEGPMHGCIVLLNSVDPRKSFYSFDTAKSYRNTGAVAFENDDLDVEQAQPFGFTDQLFTPKTMAVAQKVHYRSTGILDGTLYTWFITP